MDDYSVPILNDSGFNSSTSSNTNHNQSHFHKDHMLAAGSTTNAHFIYEIPPTSKQNVPTMVKSDYAAFANCIQQSALLDHRGTVDAAMDGGVSLGGLSDLKFPSSLSGALNNDSSFKNLSSLISIEPSSVHLTKTLMGTTATAHDLSDEAGPSFTNLLFPKDNIGSIDPKSIQNCVAPRLPQPVQTQALATTVASSSHTSTHYETFKPQENVQNYSQSSITTTTLASNACEAPDLISSGAGVFTSVDNGCIISRPMGSSNEQRLLTQNATVVTNTVPSYNIDNIESNFESINCRRVEMEVGENRGSNIVSTNSSNIFNNAGENQITTTSPITTKTLTSTANMINSNNNNNSNNNSINGASVVQQVSKTDSTVAVPVVPDIEEPGSSQTCSTNNSLAGTATATATIKVPTSASKNLPSNRNIIINKKNAKNGDHKNLTHLDQSQLHNQQPTLEHNDSSDSESLSSSDEFERCGYQDNTSSHSQQSATGSGGGGGSGANGANANLLNGSIIGGNNGSGVVSGNSNAASSYMSLLPPATAAGNAGGHMGGGATGGGGTSAVVGGSGEGIDFKHLFEELCPVCGDKVSGYHYGLLTCESCKGFFKRTVQNKKVYTCVAERSCHIDKTQRKRCPYCRFQKCLEVGMKLEAVRADRMRGGRNKFGPMYKRDRARKLQVMRQRQLALQALRSSIGSDMKSTPLSPGYQQAYPNMNIKQEIQIPQVSSLTQSPDSSPSPIAIALGQVNPSVVTTPMNGSNNNSGGGGSGGGGGGGSGGGSSGNSNNNSNNNTTSDGINRSSNSNCHETSTGSLQNTAEAKLCFDSGTHPSSTADSIIEPLRVSPMIRDFVQSIDDREWQTQLFALLQKQTYNQVEVDLFELMCKVLDQNLFSQVDWARNTVFFKDLKVDDQMKLLQHSWSDMLVLDHLHQRIHNGLPDEAQLNNGQVFNLLWLGLLGVPQLGDYFNELQIKLQDLKFDMGDYVCMKFLILLNPDVRGIINKKTVLEGHENVQAALLDYTLTCYPSVTDKFRRLLNILPDIHAMATRGEEHLYSKHCAGSAPTQTLLMEMLHAKRKV